MDRNARRAVYVYGLHAVRCIAKKQARLLHVFIGDRGLVSVIASPYTHAATRLRTSCVTRQRNQHYRHAIYLQTRRGAPASCQKSSTPLLLR